MKTLYLISLLTFLSLTAAAQTQPDRNAGLELYRQGEYEKSIVLLQEVVKTEEKDRLAWLYLGAAYLKINKANEALKAFQKSKGVYNKNMPVYDKKLKITSKQSAPYTDRARSFGVNGTVKVAVEFGGDGKIGFIFPFQGLPYGLTENVIKAVEQIKFEPAEIGGKPVTVVQVLEYSFS